MPLKLRRDDGEFSWSAEIEETVLAIIANHGTVLTACKYAGCPPSTFYYHQLHDEEFGQRVRIARKVSKYYLEAHAIQRATVGWEEPVFHEGAIVGHKNRFDGEMLRFLLKSTDPETYNRALEGGQAPAVTVNILNVLEDANDRAVERAREIRRQRALDAGSGDADK